MNELCIQERVVGFANLFVLLNIGKTIFLTFTSGKNYLLADSILSFFSSDYIRFPEDSEFSHRYVLTEKQHIQGNSKKEEIKNFFTAEIREIFKKNHVVDAAFCNCDTHEFKIKVQRHLKESEKEKLFIICDTLFGKNIDKEHVCGY